MDSTMDDGHGPAPVNGNPAPANPVPQPEDHSSTTTNSNRNSNSHVNGDAASEHSSVPMQRHDSQGSKSNATNASDETNADEATGKSGRKKKSQRFYCVDYPPCNLSFTRSEHLARHIRKHTGERPFECHCLRRFSRLDNLRQHAQTVHMHEDIPINSLAATGTRFQRQIRPERGVRVAPPSTRPRTGSLSGPGRGHSKSFSTSNIAIGTDPFIRRVNDDMRISRDRDMRPRPPPLATMDPRARQQIEQGMYQATHDGYRPITPPEMATPTSSTFSNGPGSPHWGNRVSSPFGSRPHSMYATMETPGRRLSVPSNEMHFQSPPGAHPPQGHMYSASASSNGGGFFSSPTHAPGRPVSPDNSVAWSRRESFSSTTDERRRTWHPSSRDFGGPASARNGFPGASGPPISASAGNVNAHYQPSGAEPALPIANPPTQQNQSVRLPGIDSFLTELAHRPASPPRRAPSPMAVDSEPYPPSAQGHPQSILRSPVQRPSQHRPLSGHWDNRPDLAGQTPPQEPSREWNHQPGYPHDGRGQQFVHFEEDVNRGDPFLSRNNGPGGYARGHQHTMSAPAFNAPTSRQARRQAWYNGPPSRAAGGAANGRVERMVHPNLANGFSGFPARNIPQTVHEHPPHDEDGYEQERDYDGYRAAPPPEHERRGPPPAPISGLDALVAAATSEVKATSTPAF
ncbi:Up in starvation [Sporothrix eucalyptigena]|uniref:C2H2 type master regulator of conidiophore development brlA n=1 Tax=Sporothrix eucalyptigena TaxID=1812306 RepID=A0ABP0CLW5_9PEZI